MPKKRDPSLDVLLDLDGQVLVVDPEGNHWVSFVVTRVQVSPEKPHGLDYPLTLHGPNGARLVGFDNAHRVVKQKRAGRKTIAIGYGRLGRTSTGTLRLYSPISGQQWTRCCAREE